jgi:uncharacterized phage-associated protein
MTTQKATDIANWFIGKFAESGDVVTHLKVQKLLYYSEAWHQVINSEELFEGQIQAWAHGPVVPEVFHEFKQYGWNPLPVPEENQIPKFSEKIENVLNQVIDAYGELPAKTLETMTHKDTPWIRARGSLDSEERCEVSIPKEEIKSFFESKYVKQ